MALHVSPEILEQYHGFYSLALDGTTDDGCALVLENVPAAGLRAALEAVPEPDALRTVLIESCPELQSLSFLENFPALEWVYVRRCPAVAALWDTARTPALRGLAVTDCKKLRDISGLDGAAALEHLFLQYSAWSAVKLESLAPLRGLCALRTLDLGCRGAKDKVKLDFNILPHHHAQPEGIFHHQYGGGALMEGQRRILDLCVDAGETLLANGAEIYRVQQTMEIIARSYGARSFHVYVLTNGLFASMEDGGAVQSAAVRSTPRVEMNLGRISAVNALSREIVAGRVPLEEAFARLAQIRATRGLPGWLMVSASAFSAACFCYLFGGSAVDAFTALAPGFAVGLFTRALARARTPLNKLVSNMLSAGVVALVSLACVQALGLAGVACSLDKVIIGGIIPLVPGVALTNGIRDVANCDYLSGTIRAIDAVLIAAGIALGVGLVLKGAALLPGVTI